MLHLAEATPDDWFDRIRDDIDIILLDHTHLEKRAASTALNMIFRYTERPRLARELADIVAEEIDHFSRMMDLLERREIDYEKVEPAPYAGTLVSEVRSHEPAKLLDKLLVAALIEARSAERFEILASRLEDEELAGYYAELFESEARHFTVYTDLARQYFDGDEVETRLDELAEAEVAALHRSEGLPRLHSW